MSNFKHMEQPKAKLAGCLSLKDHFLGTQAEKWQGAATAGDAWHSLPIALTAPAQSSHFTIHSKKDRIFLQAVTLIAILYCLVLSDSICIRPSNYHSSIKRSMIQSLI